MLHYEPVRGRVGTVICLGGGWQEALDCLSYATLLFKRPDFWVITPRLFLVACMYEHGVCKQITWVQVSALSLINYETLGNYLISLCLNFLISKLGILIRVLCRVFVWVTRVNAWKGLKTMPGSKCALFTHYLYHYLFS